MFKFENIIIDENGIDILKNSFHYKHLNFSEISSFEIKKGNYIQNWIFTLILGILLTFFSSIWVINSINNFDFLINSNPNIGPHSAMKIYVSTFVILAMGIILTCVSLKKEMKLIIKTQNDIFKIPIDDIEKQNQIEKSSDFLKTKVNFTKTN